MSKLKIYKASAGSGKTYTLAKEYIKELLLTASDYTHRNLLAVTFTKDATGEMKDRILSELYGLAYSCHDSEEFMQSIKKTLNDSGKSLTENEITIKSRAVLHAILFDYSRLSITTIDSFFQKILRNLARELGKGSRFNLEMNNSKILSDAVYSMIEHAHEDTQLLEWLTTYIENKLEDGKNWRIDREMLNFSRCIFDEYFQEHEQILKDQLDKDPKVFEKLRFHHNTIQQDCKGFFKTTYAKVCKMIDQQQFPLEDFTRKGVVIKLFRKLAEGDFYAADLGVKTKTVTDCLSDPEKWTASANKRKNEITEWAVSNGIPLLNESLNIYRKYNTSRMVTKNIHQLGLIWNVTSEISKLNAKNNRFMLADTALFLNKMIDHSDSSFIYEKIGAEIKHVMIDEFQDTSRLQWQNFKSLLSEIVANNYFSLVVGDVKQSIYRWRNGDWNILNNLETTLETASETLDFNYRSERQILEFNNLFFSYAPRLLNEKYASIFHPVSDSPFTSAYDPKNVVQRSKKKENKGYVSLNFIPDKTDDGKYNELVLRRTFEQIQQACEAGIPAGQICILTRTNVHITAIATFLASQKETHPELAGCHYLDIVSDEAFRLNSSQAIKIIMEALRVLARPENPIPKAQLHFFLEQSGLDTESFVLDMNLSQFPLFELIGHLYRFFDLGKIEGQSSYLFAFYDALNLYLGDNSSDIHSFIKYWEDELQSKTVPSGSLAEGIRAMTIHKSKGLQFHTVLLPYCDWDIFPKFNPIVWCGPKDGLFDLELLPVKYTQKMYDTVFLEEYKEETGQAWMDNLNLLYVAFTRAEHNLLIIGKNKKKLESSDDIKNVSDLLQLSVNELNGFYDKESLHFEKGQVEIFKEEGEKRTDNILKQASKPLEAPFLSAAFHPDKLIFKQSNKSREFVNPELAKKNEYLVHGNVMHALFSHIRTMDDIGKAVDRLCFDGLITQEEKNEYESDVRKSIERSKVEHWFSDKYKIYNECDILVNEGGIVASKRPDRVLLSEDETIIIDYKFGEPDASHQRQVQQYMQLMDQMAYREITGYVWYVEKRFMSKIDLIL